MRRRRFGLRMRWGAGTTAVAVLCSLLAGGAGAQADSGAAASAAPAAPPATAAAGEPSSVPPDRRQAVLPAGWQSSGDVAWTTSGDPAGFHLLVADARTGYTWRTAATLSEPGVETDAWVGNACLTASGRRAVVVYAPRQFTNRARLFHRGAFAAVVDLVTGKVTKLPLGVSLAYYNPGCGAGEAAVLTQSGGDDLRRTRLHWLDTAAGKLRWRLEVPGQVTSGIPVRDRIVVADGPGLVQLDRSGRRTVLARTHGTAFRVHPDGAGGVVFLEQHGDTSIARRTQGGRTAELARGPLTGLQVLPGTGGRVFLTGKPSQVRTLPTTVSRLDAPVRAEISSHGQVALTHVAARPGDRSAAPMAALRSGQAGPLRLDARVLPTGQTVRFGFAAGDRPSRLAAQGTAPAPVPGAGRAGGTGARIAGSPTDPVDNDRTCAVPRNDVRTPVYQPHWTQVEWAANLAVVNGLRVTRPTNWKQSGLQSWTPQGQFPSLPLDGGGRVPVQILLGILAQESNLWQASRHTIEGLAGNPIVGNFYGQRWGSADEWAINWNDADCGYGVGQVTDGMRILDNGMTAAQKRMVAVDYATNIAASLRILQQKWNQTRAAGITINDGDPKWIENWFAATWAYNSGMNPGPKTGNTSGCTPGPSCTDPDGNWGLGYTNNPANASYPRNRLPFLEASQDDARRPQLWPYPEKVIGWAAFPIVKYEVTDPGTYYGGYGQAWWSSEEARHTAKPPVDLFCNANLHCDINRAGEACSRADFHCWWHWSAGWKDCSLGVCGNEDIDYEPGDPEPAGPEGRNYPPTCDLRPLKASNAIIVDDIPSSVGVLRDCGRPAAGGTFGFNFATDSTGKQRSKIDLHQIGSGFGDHFWFSHTYHQGRADQEIRGTWTPNLPQSGWYRVLAHMPSHGAHTRQARYEIKLADGSTRYRIVNQFSQDALNQWAHVGSFHLAPGSSVTLTNVSPEGDGVWDIAYDAMAFIPLPAKPYTYVAIGDSYSSGEGVEPYEHNSDFEWKGQGNRCHRSYQAFSKLARRPGGPPMSTGSEGTGPYEYHLLACAGSTTPGLTDAAVDKPGENVGENTPWSRTVWPFGERQALERGFVDADTDLVTVTIGGNDAGFTDVIKGCTLNTGSCLKSDFYLTRSTGRVDPKPLIEYEPRIVGTLMPPKLRTVYQKIRELAPNAQIVVLGYPRLFAPKATRGPCELVALGPEEVDWLNEIADLLGRTISNVVADLARTDPKIRYVDVNPNFEWHRLCEASGPDDAWIYEPEIPVNSGAFHPTLDGQRAYQAALEAVLR
jgi:hypothetical protein